MRDVRAAWGIGEGSGRITRRGLVFGTLGLVVAAGLARPAAASELAVADLFGDVQGAPPPIGFRLVLKGEEVCRFRQADGLYLPNAHEWDGIKALVGSALSHADADLDKLLKNGDARRDGSKTWTTKPGAASKQDKQEPEEDEAGPLTVTLSDGMKADPALYTWYRDQGQMLNAPPPLNPKLFQHQAGAQGTPSAPGPVSVLGSWPGWKPLPIPSAQPDSPIPPTSENPSSSEEESVPVRNPIIFAFRDGRAVARFRLIGAAIEELAPVPSAAGASERPVRRLTITCKSMLVTLRES